MRLRFLRTLSLAAVFAVACSSSDAPPPDAGGPVVPTPAPDGSPYKTLDEWHLFADPVAQTPAQGVIPYDVIAPLFADYALKLRFLYVPHGKKIGWKDTDRWDIPAGSILVKTFYYDNDVRDPKKGRRLLETRLMVHEAGGWVAHTYEWDAAQKTATRKTTGDTIDVSWIDGQGAMKHDSYSIPNTNVCLECHGKVGLTSPLGPRTRQLDRDHDYANQTINQIDYLADNGLFDVTPAFPEKRQKLVDPFGNGPISDRGRSYLDSNCSHCHGVIGLAAGTAFWLDWDHTDPVKGNPADWGVCKAPASAGGTCGLDFDVVPGHADQSVVPCRTATLENKVAMPPVGHNLVHDEGVQLLKDWIDAMPDHPCQ